MTKEEVIKEAYGEYWDLLTQEQQEKVIVNNGWVNCSVLSLVNRIAYCQSKSHSYFSVVFSNRPALLEGIENNNGWTKIESEKDLPKEKGLKCLFLCVHGNTTYISDDVLEDPKWFANKYSHWRLKYEIKAPIY